MDGDILNVNMGGKLVVIIPGLNEEKSIKSVITSIPRSIPKITSIEVLVIDDGSKDNTAIIAAEAGATVKRHGTNLGVGAAFHTGIREALKHGADIIVNIDADGQFNPDDIPALIQPILDNKASFVSASRFAKKELFPEMPAIKIWGNKWMTRIINFLTNKNFTDVSCGFRAYTRDTALKLSLFGQFTYTQETFIGLAYKNVVMKEIPLKVRGEREHGRSRVASNLWRYGIKSATIIFRAARDYQPLYFFGLPGILIFLAGLAIGVFLLVHYIDTGHTTPYRSLIHVSGTLVIVGFLLLFLSMLADMQHRARVLIEEGLYHARKQSYAKNDKPK